MIEGNMGESVPVMSNAGMSPANAMSYRNSVPMTNSYIPTPVTVPSLPPRPDYMNYGMNQYGFGGMGGSGSYGMGGMGGYGMGGMGGYGMGGMGSYGMGGLGGYGMGGMGMGMGGQNPYGYGNIESRFIQIAEENSRPAFESIQSLVYAVGGVSMMLENTFYALTSSFRAILGVAENFGKLRSVFAQFWATFGAIRHLNWLIRKLLVFLGIRTEAEFKAWAEAVAATQAGTASQQQLARGSGWPVLLFFAVIAAAPYILLKMMNSTPPPESMNPGRMHLPGGLPPGLPATFPTNLSGALPTVLPGIMSGALPGRFQHVLVGMDNIPMMCPSIKNRGHIIRKNTIIVDDPTTWKNPLRAITQHAYQGASPQELSFNANQKLMVAPQVAQGHFWNTGWVIASTDGVTAGLAPLSYIKIIVPDSDRPKNQCQGPMSADSQGHTSHRLYHQPTQQAQAYQRQAAYPGQALHGHSQQGLSQAGHSHQGLSQAGQPQQGLSQAGHSHQGLSQVGQHQQGLSQAGQTQQGLSQAGQTQQGQFQAGQTQGGVPQQGQTQPQQDAVQPDTAKPRPVQPEPAQPGQEKAA